VGRDLGAQRAQLGAREPLLLLLDGGQLELRGHELGGVGDHARVLGPDPPPAGVEGRQRADALAAHDQRRHDGAPEVQLGQLEARVHVHAVVRPLLEQRGERRARQRANGAGAVERQQRLAIGERKRRPLGQCTQVRHGLGRGGLAEAAAQVRQRRGGGVERGAHRLALAAEHLPGRRDEARRRPQRRDDDGSEDDSQRYLHLATYSPKRGGPRRTDAVRRARAAARRSAAPVAGPAVSRARGQGTAAARHLYEGSERWQRPSYAPPAARMTSPGSTGWPPSGPRSSGS
jgi:hypothetical protein